jgi:hypothetical protein
MKPEIELGVWITSAYRVLSKWNPDVAALDPFDAIVTAGKLEIYFPPRDLWAKSKRLDLRLTER